ncbi:hypothetical protein [Adlercreutzia agrestimuris]|uniref:hypothetical protein n=1 Tax=Adlercreutzia agrestimuris TaxID=2941324 RepID=UPI0020416878|nr:hypothetical protein [Adlercreutzia agrestimuris]
MTNDKIYRFDGDTLPKYAQSAIDQLKRGDYICFKMTADDFIKEYASQEDYEYWMQEKAEHLEDL